MRQSVGKVRLRIRVGGESFGPSCFHENEDEASVPDDVAELHSALELVLLGWKLRD